MARRAIHEYVKEHLGATLTGDTVDDPKVCLRQMKLWITNIILVKKLMVIDIGSHHQYDHRRPRRGASGGAGGDVSPSRGSEQGTPGKCVRVGPVSAGLGVKRRRDDKGGRWVRCSSSSW